MKKVDREQVVLYCRSYLSVEQFTDYCLNGLQVQGTASVSKIVTGVTWSKKLVDYAAKIKAEMVVVHHGLFGNMLGQPPVVKGVMASRLQQLLSNNINLVGFHLPLDAHPKIGNNASICRLLKLVNLQRCDVGFVGDLERSKTIRSFLGAIDKKVSSTIQALQYGTKNVKRVGVISGGSSSEFELAREMGADTYICGDLRESVVRMVEESNMNLINIGHYNSEKFGVRNLGELIAKRFKIPVEFYDVPCDV